MYKNTRYSILKSVNNVLFRFFLLFFFSPRRLSVSSTAGQRSRTGSHVSRSNTADVDSPPPPEDEGDNDLASSSLPSPQTSPGSTRSPRTYSSPVQTNVNGIPPPPRRQDSHVSEDSSKRSRASSRASRLPRSRPDQDGLRDHGASGNPDSTFVEHDRAPSNRSLPREAYVPQDTRGRRSNLRDPPWSANESHEENTRRPSRVVHGRPLRASVSGDSRVSTPLFLPDGAPRPKETQRRGKQRNPTADSERGFDSGFFGSEGSRISRGHESPDIRPTFYPENKLRVAPLQEHSATETEDDRLHTTVPKHTPKLIPRNRDHRRRRSSLQSLSESEEDRALETSHAKPPTRTPSSQRERRSHRHTPTHPSPRSDNEGQRRLDDSLRRHASTPSLYDDGAGDRSEQVGRGSRTPTRHEKASTPLRSTGKECFSSTYLKFPLFTRCFAE